jgi:hypothetical protein
MNFVSYYFPPCCHFSAFLPVSILNRKQHMFIKVKGKALPQNTYGGAGGDV